MLNWKLPQQRDECNGPWEMAQGLEIAPVPGENGSLCATGALAPMQRLLTLRGKKEHRSFQLSFLGNRSFCRSTLTAFTPSSCEYIFRDISEIIIVYPFAEATIDLKGKETHCKLVLLRSRHYLGMRPYKHLCNTLVRDWDLHLVKCIVLEEGKTFCIFLESSRNRRLTMCLRLRPYAIF